MGAYAGLAVRAAAVAALVSAGLAGCTATASGQAPGPAASTRDAGGPASGTSQDPPVTVYVIADGAVVAIRAATDTPGRVIRAGNGVDAIAVTPDGKIAYAVNSNNAGPDVIPISTATLTAGPGLTVGDRLTGVAVTPDGRTAYVLSYETGTAIPISTVTGKPGAAISVGGAGAFPTAIAITADGKTAYVPVTTFRGDEMVTPIDTASGTAGKPIRVGTSDAGGCEADAIAITPDGKTAYVTNYTAGTVTAIAAGTAGPPIPVGKAPSYIAITPDGKTAYVSNAGSGTVTPIRVATNTPGPPIKIGKPINPIASGCATEAIAITPDGKTAYVTSYNGGTVIPISTATGTAGPPIRTGTDPFDIAITPDGKTAYVSNKGSGTVTPIDTATNTPGTPIHAGSGPGPIAIAP